VYFLLDEINFLMKIVSNGNYFLMKIVSNGNYFHGNQRNPGFLLILIHADLELG